ncbi:MAG: cadherin-like beta sandwich domain-containing protein [Bacillota bacterium]|nr:cadherin-like beta sandwich domain-containing protein [Bacillota bacterium]
MKKSILFLLILLLITAQFLPAVAGSGILPASYLASLEHNAPNTGIMLPGAFNPYQHTYLLTVASWVSRITFTCVPVDPLAAIYVNDQPVATGQPSQIIRLNNEPQTVYIRVVSGMESTTYTVFIQRRPGNDRVSAGYIKEAKPNPAGDVWTLKLDLVTVSFVEGTAISKFSNKDKSLDTYKTTPNCICYSGTMLKPVREDSNFNFFKFSADIGGKRLYRFVIIGDRIHMILPYAAD